MAARKTGPLEVDQFCRRLGDQIQAAAALDDDKACAAFLRQVAAYLAAKEIRIVQTPGGYHGETSLPVVGTGVAYDDVQRNTAVAFEGEPMRARFESRCAVCSGRIDVAASILYNREQRRAAHESCAARDGGRL